ncbi:MAG: hypothetical protein Q7U28_01800 [Aquabacterium sp.]|nr:hypothetical protein [Aquabacterium sp.]
MVTPTPHLRSLVLHIALAGVAGLSCTSAYAGESYVSVGVPGVLVGYAYSVNEQLGLRADAGTTGSIKKTDTASGLSFDATAKYNRVGIFGDYYPFSGGFRLTGGLTVNDASLKLKSRFDGVAAVTVNGKTVTPASSDYFNASLKFPSVLPYIGVGWGHQTRPAGLGLVADMGVSIGKAKLRTDTNLVGQYGVVQADVDAKTTELDNAIGKITLLPQASVGLSYRY